MRIIRNIAVLLIAFLAFNVVGALVLYGSQFIFRYTSSDVLGSEIILAIVSNIPLFVVLVPVSLAAAWLVRPKAEQWSAVALSALVLLTYVHADPVARNPFGIDLQLGVGTLLSAAIFVGLVFLSFLWVRRRRAAV